MNWWVLALASPPPSSSHVRWVQVLCRLNNHFGCNLPNKYLPQDLTFRITILFFLAYPDYKDFDNTTLFAEFPIDEGLNPVTSVELAIPIVDDDIDEADEQIFVIFLEIVNTTNVDKVTIVDRRTSIGRIRDDESKYV